MKYKSEAWGRLFLFSSLPTPPLPLLTYIELTDLWLNIGEHSISLISFNADIRSRETEMSQY